MKIFNFVNAGLGLIAMLWLWLYYTGRVNWKGEKELRRRERVQKYGWLMIATMIFGVICLLGLIINNL